MNSSQLQTGGSQSEYFGPTESLTGAYNLISSPQEKPFPQNLFCFRKYTGLRALSLFIMIWTAFTFIHTLYEVTFHPEIFESQAKQQIENHGVLKKVWYWVPDFFWQHHSESEQVQNDAQKNINSAIFWGLFTLSTSWMFLWACFDWRNISNLVFAFLSFGFLVFYNFTPGHMIENEIPIVGETDSVGVDVFSGGLGIAAIAQHFRKKGRRDLVSHLIGENPQAAVMVALEEYGISLKKDSGVGSPPS